jgi:hypothetical protein
LALKLLLIGEVLLLKINAYASLTDGLKISLILSPLSSITADSYMCILECNDYAHQTNSFPGR